MTKADIIEQIYEKVGFSKKESAEIVELVFDLMGTAIVIDPGHRLRITVTGADIRNHALYPDPSGADMPTLSIHRGGELASYVELPVLEQGET